MQARDLVAALADGRSWSGSDLAQRFGVTRAAVWKRLDELREAGLPLAAVAGRGYRLERPLALLDAAAIRAALPGALRPRFGEIEVHWAIDSTSSELLRSAAKRGDLAVCLAEQQSAGRGRRGRQWQSPLLCNVYLSLLRRFDRGMGSLAGLSLAAGVAVARALERCGAPALGLKWPNDVLAGDAKLAGILVELGGEFLGPCHAVIGVGVNVYLPEAVRNAIDQPVADLASICAALPSRNDVVAALLAEFARALDAFAAEGFAALRDDFAQRDRLRGRTLALSDADGVRHGIGAGVDARGALLLQQGDTIASFDSAEVTVRQA
ncbi:MAG TPA: biotin--[acetyl-CoA-carboxylase] ligase [Tahibacter sp.]|uniref:biotin--[acetyl-CoA-carboxylase] ligase n=1 Tax=Tahibacter sp. TaxID=2056211 RepID=UPI002C066251|nr:biotin--[acetyl-CoA-carboxylase] ligase [Tahibacter sp.]HSX61381.1 biotin--[acetyl-CoA-carboxylase] ligase [Tahibacter sp.]